MSDSTEVLAQIRNLLEQQQRLWTCEDVADYLQLNADHVRNRLVHKPGFPAAVKIGKVRRWKPEDVRAWVDRQRKAA